MSLFVSSLVALAGIVIAYVFFYRFPRSTEALSRHPAAAWLRRFWFSGWGFDSLYDALFVRPFLWLARVNRGDAIDSLYAGVARMALAFHRGLSASQTGGLRWYALAMAAGAILFLGIVILFGTSG